jgi:hypothetical protein
MALISKLINNIEIFLWTKECQKACDTPPNSLMDSTRSPKVKIAKGEKVRARSLARSTLGVEGCAGTPRCD